MTEDQIKQMVDRFLCWKLPENFHPDAGISFEPFFNNGRGRHEPSGTNLFDVQQAEDMVRYMVEGITASNVEALEDALKKAQWALQPFSDRVYNDNGDCTVSDTHLCSGQHFIDAHFVYKELRRILSALGGAAPQKPDKYVARGEALLKAEVFDRIDSLEDLKDWIRDNLWPTT